MFNGISSTEDWFPMPRIQFWLWLRSQAYMFNIFWLSYLLFFWSPITTSRFLQYCLKSCELVTFPICERCDLDYFLQTRLRFRPLIFATEGVIKVTRVTLHKILLAIPRPCNQIYISSIYHQSCCFCWLCTLGAKKIIGQMWKSKSFRFSQLTLHPFYWKYINRESSKWDYYKFFFYKTVVILKNSHQI